MCVCVCAAVQSVYLQSLQSFVVNVSKTTDEEPEVFRQIAQKSLCLPDGVYSLKLKFRPGHSVIGEEGPALDTALEGTLPSF